MRTAIYNVTVEFGDCDPANIVFYPNYYRWFDAASHHLLNQAGLDDPHLQQRYGAIGIPLMETGAVYKRPASVGDRLTIESGAIECGGKSLRIRHRVLRGVELLLEGFEVRFIAVRHPDDPKRLRAIQIPAEVCEALGCASEPAP